MVLLARQARSCCCPSYIGAKSQQASVRAALAEFPSRRSLQQPLAQKLPSCQLRAVVRTNHWTGSKPDSLEGRFARAFWRSFASIAVALHGVLSRRHGRSAVQVVRYQAGQFFQGHQAAWALCNAWLFRPPLEPVNARNCRGGGRIQK